MANEMENSSKSRGEDSDSTRLARRKFLIKGASASAPIILTVASRPAMGGNFCTPSGFLSGNLSNPDDDDDDDHSCNGKSPGYWKHRFPQKYKDVRFSTIFGGVWHDGHGRPWDPDITLYEVLKLKGHDDRHRFGFHSVAVYFNAVYRLDLNYPMRTETVVDIVQQILTLGVYTDPSTGISMDAHEVKHFFEGTYH